MSIVQIPIADRASWLGHREQDITASIVGALLGVHPYQTAYGVWALKTGRISEDPEESPAMRRGRLLEDDALQILAEEHSDWTVIPANDVYWRDTDVRLGATPDAFAIDPRRPGRGIVQVKTASDLAFKRSWSAEDQIEVPLWIACQAIVEAKLTGASWAVVLLLICGQGLEIEILDVPIHDGVFARLVDEVRKFWAMVDAGEEPAPDYGRDGGIIAELYPEDHGTEIDLSGDNALPGLIAERIDLKGEIKLAEGRVGAIDAEIKSKLGHYQRGHLNGFRISWKTQSRAGFVVQPSTFRVLRISSAK